MIVLHIQYLTKQLSLLIREDLNDQLKRVILSDFTSEYITQTWSNIRNYFSQLMVVPFNSRVCYCSLIDAINQILHFSSCV